jgi:DNA polymerase III subunit chi
MTEIAFHFNVTDRLDYTCRLLRKAVAGGARVIVRADSNALAQLDQMLWTFSATDFVAHCRAGADAATLDASPVVLAETLGEHLAHDVLVNLASSLPDGFERFSRCVEVVTPAEDDRLAARQRWKHYADRGYALKRHDLAASAERGAAQP